MIILILVKVETNFIVMNLNAFNYNQKLDEKEWYQSAMELFLSVV